MVSDMLTIFLFGDDQIVLRIFLQIHGHPSYIAYGFL